MNLITICTRANSIRLPGKHMKKMHGKPLVWWTIKQALDWGNGQVLLSTDDYEVDNYVRKKFGSKVIHIKQRRSPQFKPDNTPKIDVIRCALEDYSSRMGVYPEVAVDLDVTNPLRKRGWVEEAYQLFLEKRPPVLFSVTPAKKNPAFNQVYRNEHMGVHCPCDYWRLGSGEKVYDMNASIYIYSVKWLLNAQWNHPVCPESIWYEMPEWTRTDIDTLVDFETVEDRMGRYLL